eukprot:scaffold290200_cov23-Tisochrysis_lutea.AAC.1
MLWQRLTNNVCQTAFPYRHMLTPSTLESHAQQLAHYAEQHMEELFPVAGGSQVRDALVYHTEEYVEELFPVACGSRVCE